MQPARPYPIDQLYTFNGQRSYDGAHLLQIAFPIGGIGAGCVCLNGQGGIQDFSIRNTPAITAAPDGHHPADCAFAAVHLPGLGITRVLEGPMPRERIYAQGLKGQGYRASGHEGLPRFRRCTFRGEYPFGNVSLSDPQVPLSVEVTAFNPFPSPNIAICLAQHGRGLDYSQVGRDCIKHIVGQSRIK